MSILDAGLGAGIDRFALTDMDGLGDMFGALPSIALAGPTDIDPRFENLTLVASALDDWQETLEEAGFKAMAVGEAESSNSPKEVIPASIGIVAVTGSPNLAKALPFTSGLVGNLELAAQSGIRVVLGREPSDARDRGVADRIRSLIHGYHDLLVLPPRGQIKSTIERFNR